MNAKITHAQLNRFCRSIQDTEGKHGFMVLTLMGIACEFTPTNQLNNVVALSDIDVEMIAVIYGYIRLPNQSSAPISFFTQRMKNQDEARIFHHQLHFLQQLGIVKLDQENISLNISLNTIVSQANPAQNTVDIKPEQNDSRKRKAVALESAAVQSSGGNGNAVVMATRVPNASVPQRPTCSHELISNSLMQVVKDREKQIETKEQEIKHLNEANIVLNKDVKKLKSDNSFLQQHYTILVNKLKSLEAKSHSSSSSSATVLPPLVRPTALRRNGIYTSAFQKPQQQVQSSSLGVIKPFEFSAPSSIQNVKPK